MKRSLSILIMTVLMASAVQAQPVKLTAWWHDQVVGVSVIRDCPTPDTITMLRQKGREEFDADQTVCPEVFGSSQCPSTTFGPMWSHTPLSLTHPEELTEGEGDWQLLGGVTFCIHYKLAR